VSWGGFGTIDSEIGEVIDRWRASRSNINQPVTRDLFGSDRAGVTKKVSAIAIAKTESVRLQAELAERWAMWRKPMLNLARAATAACVLVLAIGPARAQTGSPDVAPPMTGDMLQQFCEAKGIIAFGQGFCAGYIFGVWNADFGRSICPQPGAVTILNVINIVAQYLRRHPEIRQRSASHLVMAALREAWPCPAPAGERRE
jgi:hypothetical protein